MASADVMASVKARIRDASLFQQLVQFAQSAGSGNAIKQCSAIIQFTNHSPHNMYWARAFTLTTPALLRQL